MKNKPPSPYVAPPSAGPLPIMHPDYPEFPLHKKKHPSGMTKPVRELFAKAQQEDLAPLVQKLFAEAKSKQAKNLYLNCTLGSTIATHISDNILPINCRSEEITRMPNTTG